jgi:hypothetical protein
VIPSEEVYPVPVVFVARAAFDREAPTDNSQAPYLQVSSPEVPVEIETEKAPSEVLDL